MIVCVRRQCNYCQSSIIQGQRWVRQKIYDPLLDNRQVSYHHYHAEPFAGQGESCWEKHQLQKELARVAA